MPYKPSHVANAFLERGQQDGVSISPLKLQKLMYYLHGWYLATQNEPLIGERFEAWPYGPVLSSIYHDFKRYGYRDIDEYVQDIDPKSGEVKALMVSKNDRKFRDVFDRVWDRYKDKGAMELSEMTHADGTPWSTAREEGSTYLSDDEIKDYFRRLARGEIE